MAKTIAERIAEYRSKAADYTAKADALEAQEKAAARLESLKQGDTIRFNYGRGETRGEFTGEVRAVFDTDKGKGIKVIKGSGADEEIVTIRPGDIVAIGEEVRETSASEAEVKQGTGERAPVDPLAGIE
ncbi:UNVERIFIED_ORG: Cu/Ag efflux protein CusF [Burkholderia territorii]